MRFALLLACTLAAACVPPPGPRERLGFSAHEMNAATRFGRMDIAMSFVARGARDDFAHRHKKWHNDVRIVDVDLTGLRMLTSDSAEVRLKVAWHRIDETTIRSSTVAQRWSHQTGDWQIEEELRVSGSPGLFTYPKERKNKQPLLDGTVNTTLPRGS